MNTKGSGPNDFRHSDDLSELIESMKNDALEQAKKETGKRWKREKRKYKKTQRFIEKENRLKLTKISTNFLSRKRR
jgi:beta-lactamase superfamily II metal-dependent hydrolase